MTKRKGSAIVNPPPEPAATMTEGQATNEKDSIAAAFEQSGPGPGAKSVQSTKADPTAPPVDAGTPIPVSADAPKEFATPLEDGENLPPFQQVFIRSMSEHDLAEKLKSAGVLKKKKDEVEAAQKKSNDAFKKEINQLEAAIDTILNQANSSGMEKEFTCRKRVDWDRSIVTIFDAATLEILETRQLNLKELQVEMRWAGKVPPGKQGDVIAGPWGSKPPKGGQPAKDAPAAAQGETAPPPAEDGQAPPPVAASDAKAEGDSPPEDTFTTPASELARQPGRGRGRPPKPKTEPAAAG